MTRTLQFIGKHRVKTIHYWYRIYRNAGVLCKECFRHFCHIFILATDASYAWLRRMFLNHVFCPIVWYTDSSWAGCVSPHLPHATFLLFDTKTMDNMTQKRQHVGNVRADVPTCWGFRLIFAMVYILSNDKNVAQRKRVKTHPAQLGFVYQTMGHKTDSRGFFGNWKGMVKSFGKSSGMGY